MSHVRTMRRSNRWLRPLQASGYLEVGLSALLVSTVGPLVKAIDLPVPVIACGRFASAWLILWGWSALSRAPRCGARVCRWPLVLMGCCTGVGVLCFMTAFRFMPVANAALLAYCYPVITAVLAHLFLRERVRGAVGALILSAAGALLIGVQGVRGGLAGDWRGPVLALTAASLGSIEVILMKRMTAAVPLDTLNLYRYGVAAVLVAPLAVGSLSGITGREAGVVAMLGIVQTALVAVVYVRGIQKAEVHKAAILSYLEPLSATLLAWLFLAEQPTAWTLAGGGLILAGSYLVVRGAAAAGRAQQVAHLVKNG